MAPASFPYLSKHLPFIM